MEITDPRHPVVVSETGLLKDLDPFAIGPYGNGTSNFNHDMYVRKIGSTWTLVSSYWDAGYLKFNVNDPAHPKLTGEFGFTKPISTLPDQKLNGPTVYGGYACNDDVPAIPSPSVLRPLQADEEPILVVQRGPVLDPDHPHAACR